MIGSLQSQRTEKLDSVSGWSCNPREDQWESWFELAEAWFYQPPWSRDRPRRYYPRRGQDANQQEIDTIDASCAQDPSISMSSEKASQLRRWMSRQHARTHASENGYAARLNGLPEWTWPFTDTALQEDIIWHMMLEKYASWPQHRFNISNHDIRNMIMRKP